MRTKSISNSQDVIDSRDVIERIDELRDELDGLCEAVKDASDAHAGEAHQDVVDAVDALCEWLECDASKDALLAAVLAGQSVKEWANSDEAQELFALEALQDDAEGYSDDWRHGATLVRDSYFEDYARELAEDIGAIPKYLAWPACHIDWEEAADALKADYTCVDFDGVEYWVR